MILEIVLPIVLIITSLLIFFSIKRYLFKKQEYDENVNRSTKTQEEETISQIMAEGALIYFINKNNGISQEQQNNPFQKPSSVKIEEI